jgi:hypothetical protein
VVGRRRTAARPPVATLRRRQRCARAGPAPVPVVGGLVHVPRASARRRRPRELRAHLRSPALGRGLGAPSGARRR